MTNSSCSHHSFFEGCKSCCIHCENNTHMCAMCANEVKHNESVCLPCLYKQYAP